MLIHTECNSHSSFGADNANAWLGTANGSNNAWYVNQNGNVNGNNNQNNSYVVAPALFNPCVLRDTWHKKGFCTSVCTEGKYNKKTP